jgi:carbon-monoxide dehydrogenase medium subunit
VKPAPFDYVVAHSFAEALAALAAGGADAKVLAGGQSLVPLMNFRLARPSLLVDLNRVPELAYIRTAEGGVAIGAMTRQARIEHSAELAGSQPLLVEATGWVGHIAIRSRGTLGGSLAHADPAAELPAVAVCLDAELTVASSRGRRTIAAADFFQGVLTTAMEGDEILEEVWFPPRQPLTGQAWLEFARRHGDFAIVGVAVSLRLRNDGDRDAFADARIVLAGVGDRPVRAREAETVLIGGTAAERAAAAACAARDAVEPEPDIHASGEYRKHLVAVLTERAIHVASERAVRAAPAALDIRRSLETMSRHA